MLKEIICKEFKQQKVVFHNGLNTVLGTQFGDNSIGKSTMLMIIDFAFGGNDYIEKSKDVQDNVGPHEFKICFTFNNKNYYFIRSSVYFNTVKICKEDYEIEKDITLDDYKEFLAEQYHVQDMSFRDCVSLYSRIYGRDNLNEHKPLLLKPGINDEKGIINLVKLFGNYQTIEKYNKLFDTAKEKVLVFNKASKYNLIKTIDNSKSYKTILKRLEEINTKIEDLTNKYDQSFSDIDSTISDEALDIKDKLSVLRRHKSFEESKLRDINRNLNYADGAVVHDFNELKQFFPELDIEKLKDIESFHKSVGKILKKEQMDEKNKIESNITFLSENIVELEQNLKSILNITNISKGILQNFSYLQKEKETLEKQKQAYETYKLLQQDKKASEDAFRNVLKLEEDKIENSINIKLNEVNNYIYGSKIKSPVLKLANTKYEYFTPDDTGTGTNYKNLIIFDFSILKLTQLPYIIHDSILLKQIADSALEKILELYSGENKQTFIALDKQTSYSEETQEILNNSKVISLYPNGGELFGRAWNRKEEN